MIYVRPLVQIGAVRPADALRLAGGWGWFTHVEMLERGRPALVGPAAEAPTDAIARLTTPRADWAGLAMNAPRLMGILNVTPDSFSDGGQLTDAGLARAAATRMAAEVDILDIGGESTRPGAADVAVEDEIRRTVPLITALRETGLATPISIDTRKAEVARAALQAGTTIVNDVSGLAYDPQIAAVVAAAAAPVVIMHAQGVPATMQDDPRYDDVVLDVYDALTARVAQAVAAGIDRARIVIDPGIGFGKTEAQNLALLRGMALLHGLGHPILMGASRKRFIGSIGREPEARRRGPGSIAVALAAIAQGVQILRIHDTTETAQARALWQAVTGGDRP
jgi:dihydropteroate synthase